MAWGRFGGTKTTSPSIHGQLPILSKQHPLTRKGVALVFPRVTMEGWVGSVTWQQYVKTHAERCSVFLTEEGEDDEVRFYLRYTRRTPLALQRMIVYYLRFHCRYVLRSKPSSMSNSLLVAADFRRHTAESMRPPQLDHLYLKRAVNLSIESKLSILYTASITFSMARWGSTLEQFVMNFCFSSSLLKRWSGS